MKQMTGRYGGHCERKKKLMENVKEEKGMTIMKKGKQKKDQYYNYKRSYNEETKEEKKEEERDERELQ